MEAAAVIPARYDSTRFPGKILANINGKPMIRHVYERVEIVEEIDTVIVATDDHRIFRCVEDFGGRVVMTSPEHTSGTDRIAEVARELSHSLIVNVQGDEPDIKPEMIASALRPFVQEEEIKMTTLIRKLDQEEINDPNVVKVVTDKDGNALYFSRASIPYIRDNRSGRFYKHIGLYVYRREFLLQYTSMEPTPLEMAESLEQLRVLENGYRIRAVETELDSIGVDTPEDLERVQQIMGE
ncbi:MAG: 3-deoxy-manno-octulosonate cytidylyltransferase [Halanaerobiaceae bacterium]